VPAGPVELDRLLRADCEFHAEVHGGPASRFLGPLESDDALSRSGAEAILGSFGSSAPEPKDDPRDLELAQFRAHRAAFERRLVVRAYRRVQRLLDR
jgi:hypothetical protein